MIKTAAKICSIIWLFCFPLLGNAQEITEGMEPDTIAVMVPDSLTQAVLIAADSAFVPIPEVPKAAFKPNSTKAVLLGLIPGMGQVYNRKYWKLPLVYGGFMGFTYAVTWNNRMYKDFLGMYEGIVTDAANYQIALENGEEASFTFNKKWTFYYGDLSNEEAAAMVFNTNLHNEYKRKKDYYRRYRDLSLILTGVFYFITLIDAYVDAELFNFDISPDLTMRLEPAYSPQTHYSSRNFGLNCSITF